MRAFLNGVEKRDEKFIFGAFRGTEVEAGDRVTLRDTWDRSILVLAEGSLIEFNPTSENTTYTEGAILGSEQFLFNKPWDKDLIA